MCLLSFELLFSILYEAVSDFHYICTLQNKVFLHINRPSLKKLFIAERMYTPCYPLFVIRGQLLLNANKM